MPAAAPVAEPCGWLGSFAGEARGLIGAQVGRKDELRKVGQQPLEALGVAGEDRAADQRGEGSDQGGLGRVGKRPLTGALGPAWLEQRDETLDRGPKALGDNWASGERLDHAEASEVGLRGKETEQGAKGGDHLVGPVRDLVDGFDGELGEVRDDNVEGDEEALLLAAREQLIEGATGDRCSQWLCE